MSTVVGSIRKEREREMPRRERVGNGRGGGIMRCAWCWRVEGGVEEEKRTDDPAREMTWGGRGAAGGLRGETRRVESN